MSLHTGDFISPATPSGVGHGPMPPVLLRAGSDAGLRVVGLDEQRQRVAD